ncbi:hypothetical protein K440DRAFT_646263 [Wilcoxina mikolae CBS 423.85]|nr:hypothetical protein K440DRAFT_646263 [Wilcoxina mikolae CBS 423.85]
MADDRRRIDLMHLTTVCNDGKPTNYPTHHPTRSYYHDVNFTQSKVRLSDAAGVAETPLLGDMLPTSSSKGGPGNPKDCQATYRAGTAREYRELSGDTIRGVPAPEPAYTMIQSPGKAIGRLYSKSMEREEGIGSAPETIPMLPTETVPSTPKRRSNKSLALPPCVPRKAFIGKSRGHKRV